MCELGTTAKSLIRPFGANGMLDRGSGVWIVVRCKSVTSFFVLVVFIALGEDQIGIGVIPGRKFLWLVVTGLSVSKHCHYGVASLFLVRTYLLLI